MKVDNVVVSASIDSDAVEEDSGGCDSKESAEESEAGSEFESWSGGGDWRRGERSASRRARAFGEGGSRGLRTVVGSGPGYKTKTRFRSVCFWAREDGVESPEPITKMNAYSGGE